MREHDDIIRELGLLLSRRLEIAGDHLGPDTVLQDVGIDSVELAFVFSYFERDTGVCFDDADVDVSLYKTIGSVSDLLIARLTVTERRSTVPDEQ